MREFQKWWDETYGQILTITNDPDADASCRIAKIAALDAWKAGIAALEAERDALRKAAKGFYNATVAQPALRMSSASKQIVDEAEEAGERLRALIVEPTAPSPQRSRNERE